jgi:ribosomal protein S12 methylthiotransferase accessory factor
VDDASRGQTIRRSAAPPEGLFDDRLRTNTIGILGLGEMGLRLAMSCAEAGIGRIILSDPSRVRPDEIRRWRLTGRIAGAPRHLAVAQALRSTHGSVHVATVGDGTLKHQDVVALVGRSDLVVCVCDPRARRAAHWLNRSAAGAGLPTLYCEVGEEVMLGPLVLPGASACYACYRLRRLACAADFSAAIAEERRFARRGMPPPPVRLTLASLTAAAVRLGVNEAVAALSFRQSCCTLANGVSHFRRASPGGELHTVLQHPDCPVCGNSRDPDAGQAYSAPSRPVDMRQVLSRLVSPLVGIIRQCEELVDTMTDPGPPYFYQAALANHCYAPMPIADLSLGYGKGMGRRQAYESAVGEALELYAGSEVHNPKATYARRDELGAAAIDPRSLVLYAEEQYSHLPYARCADHSVLGWVPAQSIVSKRTLQIPALAAFLDYAARSEKENLFPPSSNGLATGRSLTEAILAGLAEVLERDAFLITWLNRLPARPIDPLSHPEPRVRRYCGRMRRRGIEVRLFHLPTDHCCHVIMAVGRNRKGELPAICVGLGADLDIAAAARKSVIEMAQCHAGMTLALRRRSNCERMSLLADDSRKVETMDDHALLYASPKTAPAFDFLFDMEAGRFDGKPTARRRAIDSLRRITASLAALGHECCYIELTPRELRPLGPASVRVVVPHFQPVHFGSQGARLGGARLFDLPLRLGLARAPTTIDALNRDPHPLG